MKRAYAKSQYAKPYEQYCRELYPGDAARIFEKAETYYLTFMKDMPDLGKNMMAKNMLDWFTILSFYEASEHRLDGEALLAIKHRVVDKMKFIGKLVDGNRQKWPYRLFERTYKSLIRYRRSIRRAANGWTAGVWRSILTTVRRAFVFTWSAARSPNTQRNTVTRNFCLTFARPTIISPRSCMRG